MKETRTATPNYGFNQIDSIQDESMLFPEYIEKDSKENWQKADTVIKNIEDKVDNKINLNGKYYDSLNFISDGNSTIKELHTTDHEGKTSTLKLGSDSHHTEMASGRTLEEEYTSLIGRFGKEIDSPDGIAIQVNNGISGKVLKMLIRGKTIKNYCPTVEVANFTDYGTNKIENNVVTINANGAFSNAWMPYKGGLESNKAYKCVAIIYENTLSGTCNLFGDSMHEVWQGTSFLVKPKQTGIIVKTLTTKQDIDSFHQISRGCTTNTSLEGELIKYSIMVLDENSPIPISYIPFGLSSTQAIISNNGEGYPIYATEEDKANKRVVLLGGVGGVQDTLEIKDDGGVVYTQNTKEIVLDNNINCTLTNSYSSENHLFFNISAQDIKIMSDHRVQGIMCDKFKWEEFASFASKDYEFICGNNVNAKVGIKIAKTKLESPTVEGFKKWLQNNPVTVQYQLATPIVTHIPKELVPTILTHNQTNTIEAGDKVKASSFKVTVPTTDGIKKEYILTPINGWAGTAKANLLQTGDAELVLDLIIPEQFNTAICSLPTELRPKAERTVLGYNGNTPVVIKVLPTGEVKCMTQQSGKIELDDAYEI